MAVLRGRIESFDSGTWTARVRLDGSPTRAAGPFHVSRGIDEEEMTAGRRALVEDGGHGDPGDAVVVAVWAG